MDLRKLGGVWPRVLTAAEEASIIVNQAQATDAATAANPPNKDELAALAATELLEVAYQKAIDAYDKALQALVPRATISPRGELQWRETTGRNEVADAARAAVDAAREDCQRARVKWTVECQKRAARIAAWRLKHPDK